jgi:inositol 1,4,5-triphosphate receptor type 1/inositol 1,4,5-triphosphate receptor type 3
MNILIFAGYSAEKDDDGENVVFHVEFPGINKKYSKFILLVLGCIISIFSLIKLFEFVTREAILIFKTLYSNYLREAYEARIINMSDLEIHRIEYFFDTNSFRKILIYIYLVLDIKVFYALAYMAFALLGITVHNFFFAFHLIEFIISQPILQYVFRAIVDPIAQLAYTFLFFFILIYFYSLIIFYNFQDIMPKYSCDSPVICMVFIYSNTFTSGGNLGNFIDEGGHENSNGDMIRYALDISYTIIMVWLVWQMVSGLIVDTFESLRGEREKKEDDMKSTCFICGLKKEKIEKYYPGKEGFEKHLKDHSIINYFFYTFYLEDKDSSEYSGLESYIKNQIDKESITWFPQGKSLKIEEWENKHKGTHEA